MRIVFFGTPPFAAEILEVMITAGFTPVGIVTNPDRPRGRSGTPQPTAVKMTAQSLIPAVPIFQPEKASELSFSPTLQALEPDLFVVVAYGEIIKKHLLDMPKKGCINVHGSLLPKYRGAAPVQRALMDGVKETGVTVMFLAMKMDAGDIISQNTIAVDDNINSGELLQKMSVVGSEALIEVLHRFEQGSVEREQQNEALVTMAPKITTEECKIVWENPAQAIHNLVRGAAPRPGAWCDVDIRGEKKRMKINRTEVVQREGGVGEILEWNPQEIVVACGAGALKLLELQLEGKKAATGGEFTKGHFSTEIKFV
jgi:methionyl-tRNA formyltransferase